jgi:4-amino-4-deoxy-L-arabinose transferase-like glycosyltransferase
MPAVGRSRAALRWYAWIFAFAYVVPGLVGHDPWKPDEAYSFGIIYNMYRTGDLVVPTLAGDPFMEKPPAYYITAAGMVHLLSPWLAPHDAARLTTGLYLGLALVFTALLGSAAWGPGRGPLAVLILLSTLGLLTQSHWMITDTALLAGMAMAYFGLLRGSERAGWGGIWLGTGAGLAFLSKGLLGPGIVGLSALLLPSLFREWRTRTYARTLAVACAAALPWVLIWPTALYLRSEALFTRWFWDNNLGRYVGFAGLGPRTQEGFWWWTVPWVTFPALLAALWTLWRRGRAGLRNPGVRVALAVSAVGWPVLFFSATGRDLYALPLLPPLALIAAGAIGSLPRRLVAGTYWVSTALFGLLAAVLWGAWAYMMTTGRAPQWQALGRWLPLDFIPRWQWIAVTVAAALQIGWLWTVLRHRPPQPAALLSWPAGLILGFGLLATLHLAWFDYAYSYRSVFVSMQRSLPAQYDCIADIRLRESERGMLHYVAGIVTRHIHNAQDSPCSLVLVETRRNLAPDGKPSLGPGWRLIWDGNLPANRREWFLLFRRLPTGAADSGRPG